MLRSPCILKSAIKIEKSNFTILQKKRIFVLLALQTTYKSIDSNTPCDPALLYYIGVTLSKSYLVCTLFFNSIKRDVTYIFLCFLV